MCFSLSLPPSSLSFSLPLPLSPSLSFTLLNSEVEMNFDFSVSCRVLRDALGRRYGVRNPSFYGLRHQGRVHVVYTYICSQVTGIVATPHSLALPSFAPFFILCTHFCFFLLPQPPPLPTSSPLLYPPSTLLPCPVSQGIDLNLELSPHDQGVLGEFPIMLVRHENRVSAPLPHEPPVVTKGEYTGYQATHSDNARDHRMSFLQEGEGCVMWVRAVGISVNVRGR